eukprot:TRINITY_DN6801_c0_g1_i3.p1 TRINITY_DN6801_c0_g1~~TRINITY_DN6801_c0_g1_i3.p1  ORF type:complete len:416 (+),score=70.52 TRINITY_DN6801_c0_g1_i3:174-1421(+)
MEQANNAATCTGTQLSGEVREIREQVTKMKQHFIAQIRLLEKTVEAEFSAIDASLQQLDRKTQLVTSGAVAISSDKENSAHCGNSLTSSQEIDCPDSSVSSVEDNEKQAVSKPKSETKRKTRIKLPANWNPASLSCIETLVGHKYYVKTCVYAAPDLLFTASHDKDIMLWDLSVMECTHIVSCHNGPVNALLYDSDTARLYSASSDKTIQIIDATTMEVIGTLGSHAAEVLALAKLGPFLFSTGADTQIKVWDTRNNACINTLTGHKGAVQALAINDRFLCSAGRDRDIKVWDLSNFTCIHTLSGHFDTVTSLSTIGNLLFSGGKDKNVRVWDLASGKCARSFPAHRDWVTSIKAVGTFLITGSKDKLVKVWDLNSVKCVATLKGHTGPVNCIDITEQGQLFTVSHDKTVKIWDM